MWKGQGPLILAYHRINYPAQVLPYDLDLLSATPESFRRQMLHVVDRYSVVSLSEISRWLRSEVDLPRDSIAITFDDGYADFHTYAFPVLKSLDIPATLFLIAGAAGSDKPMWWDEAAYLLNRSESSGDALTRIKRSLQGMDESSREERLDELARQCGVSRPRERLFLDWTQVSEIAASGIAIGSHSYNHATLTRIDRRQLRREIEDSRDSIADRTGQKPLSFCYPYGLKEDSNDLVRSVVSQAGYQCAATLNQGTIDKQTDPFCLSRMHVSYEESLAAFTCRVAGMRFPRFLSARA
jgi:peptidoglycan/xylan/chitin deacetylase (PgdA/CDA1 family)